MKGLGDNLKQFAFGRLHAWPSTFIIYKNETAVDHGKSLFEPRLSNWKNIAPENLSVNHMGHHVEGGGGAQHQFVSGHLGQFRVSEMRQVKKDKSDEQQGKGNGHGTVNSHGGNPHDKGVNRPADQKPSQIRRAGMVHVVVVEQKNNAQGDPEGPIRNKGTVTEIVADFEFLVSGDQLRHATEYECQRNDRTDTTPAHVVELEQQGRDAESREPDDARVATGSALAIKRPPLEKD